MSEMNGTSTDPTDLRAVVADRVENDFRALCAEVDKMRPSGLKTELEETSLPALASAVENVREASALADAVRAAHVYSGLVRILVVGKVRQGDRKEGFEKSWQELRELLLTYERTELLVAAELRHLAADIEEKLAGSRVVQKLETLVDQLRSSNENLEKIVANIPVNNQTMSAAISGTGKELSAIHDTVTAFAEGMVGPMARHHNGSLSSPNPDQGPAVDAAAVAAESQESGGAG
jgi:hypothetical protein